MQIESYTPYPTQGARCGNRPRRIEPPCGGRDVGVDRPAPARSDGRLLFAEFLKKGHARAAEKSPGAADRTASESPSRSESNEPPRAEHTDRPGPRLADVPPTREITKHIQVEQTYQVRLHSTLGNMIDILM